MPKNCQARSCTIIFKQKVAQKCQAKSCTNILWQVVAEIDILRQEVGKMYSNNNVAVISSNITTEIFSSNNGAEIFSSNNVAKSFSISQHRRRYSRCNYVVKTFSSNSILSCIPHLTHSFYKI